DLRGLPSTETYQLWGLIGGKAISLGLLGPSPAQGSFQVGSPRRVEELMVTVEPSGGVVRATGPPVVSGRPVAA
ncbi:MAG: anti-sigma factor domain-containing protein, partial [Acidimicrobiales bacterium]